MQPALGALPANLRELRGSQWDEARLAGRGVKDELRENLIARLESGAKLFPGIVGYHDSVIPQIANAILSRHNFILLGLRGQAKTRLIRMLTALLDERLPYLAGTAIRDNPYRPVSAEGRRIIEQDGEKAAIAWMTPEERYIEKLATPDVTIADMIGDIDPIKAARRGQDISDELTIHYGLVPRANRGIFAINELPDLAGKIQVGLFNIMQEGDVQIKGYPVRLPLDILLVFTANPDDYTARGKIITPLKDRIGSEIRTHYPAGIDEGVTITRQEAWVAGRPSPVSVTLPGYMSETIEQIAFLARDDKRVDKRSGVSQRMPITVTENVVSNAERRGLSNQEPRAAVRITDLYAALPSITGKMELEYEGELRGGDQVARELVRSAVGRVFTAYYDEVSFKDVVQWFDLGGTVRLDEDLSAAQIIGQLEPIQGLLEKTAALGLKVNEPDEIRAAAGEFVLEGLCAHRRLSRNEERVFSAGERRRDAEAPEQPKSVRKKSDLYKQYQ